MRSVLFIVLFACSNLFAQNNKTRFFRVPKGLSQHTITSIVQDDHGFLWFGTRYGLNRYDGLRFTTYKHLASDSTSLGNSTIKSMIVDKKGDLWIGTSGGGLSHYLYDQDKFMNYRHDPDNAVSLSDNFINTVYEDDQGSIWIGTENGGLNKFEFDSNTFTRYYANQDDPLSIADNHVTAIQEDKYGNLWIGTINNGMSLFDSKGNRFTNYNINQRENGLDGNSIRSLYQGRSGSLWVGGHGIQEVVYHKNGRYSFRNIGLKNKLLSDKLAGAVVLSICEDKRGQLWVGTENEGLFIIDLKTNDITHYTHNVQDEYSLSGNSIWAIAEDRTGTIWIGIHHNGINKVDPFEQKFQAVLQSKVPEQGLSYGLVSSFAEDQDGTIWIGTDGGGLNHFNPGSYQFMHYENESLNANVSLSSNAIVSLIMDERSDLWIGTWNGGVNLKKSGSKRFIHIRHDPDNHNSPSGNDIYDLYQDKDGDIWMLAFRDGLDRLDVKTGLYHHYMSDHGPNSITSNYVRTILQDNNGYYWLGTEGSGLDRIHLNDAHEITQVKNYSYAQGTTSGLSHNTITCLYQDTRGNLWIGTEGGGLNKRLDNDTFQVIDEVKGMPGNVIYSIEEDDFGKLWISTNQGLAKYDPLSNNIEKFTNTDGLQSLEFYKASSYKTTSGALLFGGINGFNMFYPTEVEQGNENIPPVHITRFSIFNEEVRPGAHSPLDHNIIVDSVILLHHDQDNFSFEFSALNYSQSIKNQYEYKLENYDRQWQSIGNRNSAFYTNVSPGEYVFRVRASNNDNLWNMEGTYVKVIIARPWYFSNWAYIVYFFIFAAILYIGRQNIIHRERLKSELQLEHVELTKMQEMSAVRSRFFANISHEFRTPLTLIISPLKTLYLDETGSKYRKQIKMMLRNAERLLRLINQILDLSKLESGSMKLKATEQDITKFIHPIAYSFINYADKQYINYKINLPKEPVMVYFEKDQFEKVLINLLSNAFKYTPEFGKIQLSVTGDNHQVVIEVKDTGIGIHKDQLDLIFNRYYRGDKDEFKGTGIGLALTKELVELHKGKISVSSTQGQGTSFTVTIPLGHQHLKPEEISSEPIAFGLSAESLMELDEMGKNGLLEKEADPNDTQENDLPLILIAEDNVEVKSFIVEFLETTYRILEAEDGVTALEMAKEQIPDLIITDVMMPELDGYQLCQKLKQDEKTSHVPIIMLTAKASGDSMERGFEMGVDYYVTKPFNPKLLELRIKNILRSRHLFKEQVLHNKTVNLDPKHVTISSADENFLKKVVACVEENMSDSNFQIDDLCKHLGLSRIQLYRKLKGLIGQSGNEFIRSVRLKRAAQLIRQDQLTIAEITYLVGFNDLQYFRDCFKKQFGVKPSEYMTQNRESEI
ncbi:two-component regulator propeller domain-containing protein [Fulvivirga sp. M361]|uniref:two-component regulator propeller domain-containing protein n=1 Tax=Fulvivirga sp. M361 TaxID=2594266 RepID=UPI00162A3BF4|nr:two-component regulator propeller domain-containing protein [Fulvivirga sp. M361]